MRVYRVSPILQYSPFFRLTYFSKFEFEVGDVCEIDLNKRRLQAIVVEILDMNDAKIEIRSGNFKTKKIDIKLDEAAENFFTKKQFDLVEQFANKFLLPPGEVVFAMFGDSLSVGTERKESKVTNLEIFPTKLTKGVGLSGVEVFKELENIRKQNNFKNLIKIVINDFDIDNYIQYQAPHISQIHLLFLYLQLVGFDKKIIIRTSFLGVQEKHLLDNLDIKYKLVEEEGVLKKFIYNKSKKKFNSEEPGLQEKVLDDDILEVLEKSKKTKEKTFVFALSSGYQSRIFCKDCKSGYGCDRCEHNYSILNELEDIKDKGGDAQVFRRCLYCKECEHRKVLKDDQYLICKKCGSWGLFPFGEGGQKIYEELGGTDDIVFIDESVKKMSDKNLEIEVKGFLVEQGKSILLGTKRTLKVLSKLLRDGKEDKLQTLVVSLGPISGGKSFDADEKFIKLLSELESVSSKIYIGKKDNEDNILNRYKTENNFVKEELKLRKMFSLPPFSNVVSLSFDKRLKPAVNKYLKDMAIADEKYKGNKIIYHLILTDEEAMKNRNLLENLRQFGELVLSGSLYENFLQR